MKDKKNKSNVDDFKKHVTINFNTFQFNAKTPEELSEITSKILEDLPQVKENYYTATKSTKGVIPIGETTRAYAEWKSDLMQASNVVMDILSRCPKSYGEGVNAVIISPENITLK